MEKEIKKENFKIFDLYDLDDVKVEDPGLQTVINLEPKLVIKSHGRAKGKFAKVQVNIVERLINQLQVPGHRGKKHKIITSHATGKFNKNLKIVLEVFKALEKKYDKNPVQIFVKAIENASPRDEITVIEYGGARYPQAVDISPLRRVNITLRYLVQGGYDKAFNKKKTIVQGLTDEISLAYEANMESFAMQKKNESEKQADSAR